MTSMMYRVENTYGFLVFADTSVLRPPVDTLTDGATGILIPIGDKVTFKENIPGNLIVDGHAPSRLLSVTNRPDQGKFLIAGHRIELGGRSDTNWHDMGLYFWLVNK